MPPYNDHVVRRGLGPGGKVVIALALVFMVAFVVTMAGIAFHMGRDGVRFVAEYNSTAAKEARADGQWRRELAAEVADGSKTFEEAGCEYRSGEWDRSDGRCNQD